MRPGEVSSSMAPTPVNLRSGGKFGASGSFNIVFIAEAYTQELPFKADIWAIEQKLENFAAISNVKNSQLSIWTYFEASTSIRPSQAATPDSHRTLLGSAIDANGDIGLDVTAYQRLTETLLLDPNGEPLNQYLREASPQYWQRTLCVVLCPAPTNNQAPAAAFYRAGTTVPQFPSAGGGALTETDVIVLQMGDGAATVVAQELARLMGLAPEWVEEAQFGALLTPTSEQALQAIAPNLFYLPPHPSGSDAIYFNEMHAIMPSLTSAPPTDSMTKHALPATAADRLAPAATPAATPETIEAFWEGGGGFHKHIYRSHEDCVMRRQLGHPTLPLRVDDIDFCPACKFLIRSRLENGGSVFDPTLSHQKLVYDKVKWGNAAKGESVQSAFGWSGLTGNRLFDLAPGGNTGDDFWKFTLDVSLAHGLRLLNVKHVDGAGTGSMNMAMENKIAREIRFRDLRVVLDDDTSHDLNIADAFSAGNVEVRYGTLGRQKHDSLWQFGFRLSAEFEVANKVRVTVVQAIALRGANADFDPTVAVVAMKAYPQLSFEWQAIDNTSSVKSFHGTIWQDLEPISSMSHGGGHDAPPSAEVFSSWFSEIDFKTNAHWYPFRLKHNSPLPPSTFFAGLFSHWYPQPENEEKEIIGARRVEGNIWAGAATSGRSGTFDWQAAETFRPAVSVNVTRARREGQYDNLHTHGWMGWTQVPRGSQTVPRVMAPACGEACIHIHWRWFEEAYLQNGLQVGWGSAEKYAGWGDNPLTAQAASVGGNPMIPPNQRLRVAVTNSNTNRASDSSVLGGATIHHGATTANALDLDHRALWYDVDVEGWIAEGAPQVLMEHGWGFAVRHELGGSAEILLRLAAHVVAYQPAYWGDPLAYGSSDISFLSQQRPFNDAMMVLYDDWRFYYHGREQVPHGTHSNGTITMEEV